MAKRSSVRHASEMPGSSVAGGGLPPIDHSHAMLLIPRVADDAPAEVTFASAAYDRAPQRNGLRLERPAKSASGALQRIGMEDMEKLQVARPRPGARGVFARMGSLGATAAFFGREQDEDDARTELESEYEFVPNFNLSVPARVKLDGVAATRGRTALAQREWPVASGVSAAHDRGIRGGGVLVGVLDTGVDADHEEFADQTITYRYVSFFPNSPYWPPRDVRGFDTDGHGSHVCGIIAGRNTGVAPESRLFAASVIESETTRTSLIRVASGLDWILRQFSRPDTEHLPGVLNMSLGFPPEADGMPEAEYRQRLKAMRTLIRTLVQANILPLVAIGNDGADRFGYPGGFKEVVAVGAVDFQHKVASFSGSGRPPGEGVSKPDLAGYGVGVYSSVERDYEGRAAYQRFSGTSMATPYVAGIAALYRCREPQLTVAEVADKMKTDALKLTGQPKPRVGAGLARFVP